MKEKRKILFLCTGNSCRSQMAEGWGKALKSETADFYSAGTTKHGLNPYAVRVMREVGVDITEHYSKTLDDLSHLNLDLIITVCSEAHESCPIVPGKKVLHHGFEDPPSLAKDLEDEEEILEVYRKVRDEIKEFILNLE